MLALVCEGFCSVEVQLPRGTALEIDVVLAQPLDLGSGTPQDFGGTVLMLLATAAHFADGGHFDQIYTHK